jgi:peptidoglycan/LPS O-acetylase OafA/YrhL
MVYHYKSSVSSFINKVGVFPILAIFSINILTVVVSHYVWSEKFWFFNAVGTWVNLIFSGLMIILLLEHGRTFFSKKTDRFLGDLSYPVYIFHWSGASLASWLITSDHNKGFWVFFLGLGLTILISIFVNKCVNDNVEKLRNIIRPKKVKQ